MAEVVNGRNMRVVERMVEKVFLDLWTEACTNHCGADLLQNILNANGIPVGERYYIIAESIMQWLGSNGGANLLERVKSRKSEPDKACAFKTVWAEENTLKIWTNAGTSALEFILIKQNRQLGCITDQDQEIVDVLLEWLGSPMGQEFILEAERRIRYVERIVGFSFESKFCPEASYLNS